MPGAEDATSTWSHKRDGAGKVNRSIGGHSLSSNLRVASLDVEGDEKVLVEFDDAPEPPDGGWGWVVCFACFMGTPLSFMNYHFGRKFADSHFRSVLHWRSRFHLWCPYQALGNGEDLNKNLILKPFE